MHANISSVFVDISGRIKNNGNS